MVPVKLELHNFMSYGTHAPVLDFRPIHVACLSGGNGQGKSALLDAMTWAVWGEARKSSGSRKPDDEVLRIGSKRMKVSFTFDVDGARYRVERSYQRSATGKTSRSELEVQAFDTEKQAYVPLTGGSMRETQATIERIVGLDYDTFINSAFLLQGRSDEFTKKRPSERKEILSRILNLDRFERLYARARERALEAKRQVEHLGREIERLTEAVAHEEDWGEEREALEEEIEQLKVQLDAAREREQELARRLAHFEALRREEKSVGRSIEALKAREKQLEKEAGQLAGRIREAEELIAEAETIEREAKEYDELQAERERLDEEQERHRALEKKLAEKERAVAEKRHALEQRLSRLQADRQARSEQLVRCREQFSARPELEKKLRGARAAGRKLAVLQKKVKARRQMEEEITALRQAIHGQREALQGELRALRQRCLRNGRSLPDLEELEGDIERLAARFERRKELEARLEEIQEKGQRRREHLSALEGQRKARQAELREEQEALAAFEGADGEDCPMCGTVLTDGHRTQVLERYRQTIDQLDDEVARSEAQIEKTKKEVKRLRRRYREVRAEQAKLEGVAEKLATAREKREQARAGYNNLKALQKQADELQATLQEEAFAQKERRKLKALEEKLGEFDVDEEALEALRGQAAEEPHYAKRVEELEGIREKKAALEKEIAGLDKKIASVEAALDDGEELSVMTRQIATLRQEVEDTGFDPKHLREVRGRLRERTEAPSRLKDLEHARKNRAEWQAQQKVIEARGEEARKERREHEERKEEIVKELAERELVTQAHRETVEEREKREEALQEKQRHYGQLSQQLKQAKKDRAALKKTRGELSEAKSRRRLYKHLQAAFSKHGIPSLLIEQALPEIEQRANALLERVAEGKMHVRLETLKDKKTGGTKETLEIIITDEQGVPRAYETFSGGEAFRVNFALRLALAQLLAERNGVQVHTLVIDEGFGTQDEEGIENLVEAIHSVKDDFEKILVITHLNELKEAFPVRIEVEKDPALGSTFEMIGV